VHAHRDTPVDALRGPDQLQRKTERTRVADVVLRDLLDPLEANIVDVNRCVEGKAREDRHLRRGVRSADVIRWVGFGVAEALRLGERSLVTAGRTRHLAEDEVRRAIDDAVHALDLRARERFAQDSDRRDDARDRRLEADRTTAFARELPELLAVAREELLIGGHDVAARFERRP